MKKIIFNCFIVIIISMMMVGCTSLLNNNSGVFGKASQTNEKIDTKIRQTENEQAESNEEKLSHIAAWSKGGVEHSLEKITNGVPKEVEVAKQMNDRIEALAGSPDFKEVESIKGIVDDLLSEVGKTKLEGEKRLSQKDKEISQLQQKIKDLDTQREDQIANAMSAANENAKKADQYQATLNNMDKWFGLGAVFYGIKKLVISSMWILGIGSVLFLILRILSTTNPIASAIFGIFDQIGVWMIHIIQLIIPKAVSLAGNVSLKIFDSYKSTLTKIVDAIQMAKTNGTTSGKTATIEDALNEVEKTMTPEEKIIVDEIKKSLNWK